MISHSRQTDALGWVQLDPSSTEDGSRADAPIHPVVQVAPFESQPVETLIVCKGQGLKRGGEGVLKSPFQFSFHNLRPQRLKYRHECTRTDNVAGTCQVGAVWRVSRNV